MPFYGPAIPLYAEAVEGLSEDELTLGRLSRLYRPPPDTVHGIADHIAQASQEDGRVPSEEYWLRRPV